MRSLTRSSLLFFFAFMSLGHADIFQDAAQGDLFAVQRTLEQDATTLTAVDLQYGATPLHFAAFGGHTEVVKILLKAGAAVDSRNLSGWTPLHYAAYAGSIDVVNELLNAGANPVLLDGDGNTPRAYAGQNGHAATAILLVDAEKGVLKVLQGRQAPAGWVWLDALGLPSMADDAVHVFVNSGTNNSPLCMGGVEFVHGCGVFIPREFTVNVNGAAKELRLCLGVNDEGAPSDIEWNATFSVVLDGEVAFVTSILHNREMVGPIAVDLTGVRTLKITVTGNGPASIAGACLRLCDEELPYLAAFMGDRAAVDIAVANSPEIMRARDRFFRLTLLQSAYYGAQYGLAESLAKRDASVGELPPEFASGPDQCPMVFVPGGAFAMGADFGEPVDRMPTHQVMVSDYYIDQHEVTNEQFAHFLNAVGKTGDRSGEWVRRDDSFRLTNVAGRWQAQPGYEMHPVVNISWHGASAYAAWAGKRLPTEAEWEKAARGLHRVDYPWGQVPEGDRGNVDTGNAKHAPPTDRVTLDTVAVGTFSQGVCPYGCFDMVGNVTEWTSSLYAPYPYNAEDGREDPLGNGPRVLRGVSFMDSDWMYWDLKYRATQSPSARKPYIGFRCVRSAP